MKVYVIVRLYQVTQLMHPFVAYRTFAAAEKVMKALPRTPDDWYQVEVLEVIDHIEVLEAQESKKVAELNFSGRLK